MCSFDKKENLSPFDLPKLCQYEYITDYHLKKADQLAEIKNYRAAVDELRGLLACAIKNDDKNLAKTLEDKILKAEGFLSLREEGRIELKSTLTGLAEFKDEEQALKAGIESIKKFVITAAQHEEYYFLIEKIVTFHLKKLKTKDDIKKLLQLLTTFDPLKYIVEYSSIEAGINPEAFILFDLDSTLFDNSPRVHRIIREFAEARTKNYRQEEIQKVANFKREEIVWGIKQNIQKMNILDEELKNDLVKFWFERFFSNDYIIDEPLRGATAFVSDLEKTGIKIVYLSGRVENMREGTARNIIKHGFPLKGNEHLLLKPDMSIADHTFKHNILEKLKKEGHMTAGFDNEPQNVNIFQEHFPGSQVFFLETNHSIDPPNLFKQIHTIRNFSYLSE